MFVLISLLIFQNFQPLQYIDPLDRMPAHYEAYAVACSQMPFTWKVISSHDAGRQDLIIIMVNDSLYPSIQSSVSQYIQDLTDEGYSTLVMTMLGGTPADIRALLIAQLPNDLIGTVMIGDLPIAWWEDGPYGEDYPVDLFYTDLNGTWTDTDSDGKYDSHTGPTAPDIWAGRLYASHLTYDNEVCLINNYFHVNHEYRTGALTLPDKGLVYNEVTWYPNDHGMGNLYTDVTMVNSENTTTAYDYKNRLEQEFQFIHLIAHSSCWAHTFFLQYEQPGGGSVFSFEIPFVNPKAFFIFLNCCMAARFTEIDNLANWYAFSRSYTQVVIASSSLMYGIDDMPGFYTALANDSTLGAAFKMWHQANYDWFMGTLVLGDPSLKILSPTQCLVQHETPHYSGPATAQWTLYQVENSPFVNGHPSMGHGQDDLWIFWDSGRIVRSDTYGSFFTGSGFAPAESIAWHEYYDFYPAAATDHSGRLWVCWQSFRDYNQNYDHFNIYSTYYFNNAWSVPQHIQPMGGWHDVQPDLAAGSDDKVWVIFTSFRDGNANIYVSNADAGGAWSSSSALTQTPEDETGPAIAVDLDNNAWAFWTAANSGHYHIYGREYTGAWHDVFTVDTSRFDNAGLDAAIDSLNQVWLVWHRWINDQSDIYYSYYDGSQWLAPQSITSDPAHDLLASITIDALGRPWICWMSDRDGDWNIYSSYYDGGWTIPAAVTQDTAQDIDPVIMGDDQSEVWISWASNRNDYWNIFACSTDITDIREHDPVVHEQERILINPNPFSRIVQFTAPGPIEIKIYNSAGRLVLKTESRNGIYFWRPAGLSPGVYFARIQTGDSQEYVKVIYVK
jgi:hypothetical protein